MKITKSRLKQIIKEELQSVLSENEEGEPLNPDSPAEWLYNLYRPAADIGYDVHEDANDNLKSKLDAWAIQAIRVHVRSPGGLYAPDSPEKIMAAVRRTSENELQASRSYEADIAELREKAEASGEDTRWPRGANERRAQFDRDMQEADQPIKALGGYEIIKTIYSAWEEANYAHEDEMGYGY